VRCPICKTDDLSKAGLSLHMFYKHQMQKPDINKLVELISRPKREELLPCTHNWSEEWRNEIAIRESCANCGARRNRALKVPSVAHFEAI